MLLTDTSDDDRFFFGPETISSSSPSNRSIKINHTAAPPLASIAERDERELSVPHESGWDQKQWRENIRECRKSSYLLHGYTGHGIFPATHPDTYVYIPTNLHEIKKPKAKMYDAGFVFAVKTTETIQNIVKWYVLCALEKNCMGGDYSKICSFSKNDRFSKCAHCHRYDQSIVNLLLANAYFYDRHYYVSEIVDHFKVVRMPSRHVEPLTCVRSQSTLQDTEP